MSLPVRALEQRPEATILAIGAAFVFVYALAVTAFAKPHGRIVEGDAVHYYVYLRSLVFDHDVDFHDDYAAMYGPSRIPRNIFRTRTGHLSNVVSIGPALLWMPFFLAALALVALAHALGLASAALDGVSPPFQISAGIAGVVYATLGALLCYRACRLVFPSRLALWGTLAAWLATPAVYYSVVSPAYSHATSMFAVALFAWFWLSTRERRDLGRYALLGALAGIGGLVRWQDLVIAAVVGLEAVAELRARPREVVRIAARMAVMALFALLAFAPQLLAWRAIYGEWALVPGKPGYVSWFGPRVLELLFGYKHGLLYWTPAVALALAGLPWVVRRDALAGWGSVLVITLFVYVNAAADPGAGEGFGARRFVADTVFFALGFAGLGAALTGERAESRLRAAVLALVIYNGLFVVQYQLFMRGFRELVAYPVTPWQILGERLVLPLRLLRRALGG
jgi:hypothetical protein